MLKQSVLFKKLKQKKLSIRQYEILYKLSDKPKLSEKNKKFIREQIPSIYIELSSCVLSNKGHSLLKEIDSLYKPLKMLKNIDLLGINYKERITEFINIFPTQKLPSGKYARGNKKNIEENFMWFFQEYPDYTWNIIIKATHKYIDEYHINNYKYMRTSMFFIKKLIDGTVQSELANYCDIIISGDDYTPDRQIKSNIV